MKAQTLGEIVIERLKTKLDKHTRKKLRKMLVEYTMKNNPSWFGKNCEYQICSFEGWWAGPGEWEEDRSQPLLIFCNHKCNSRDHEGNCYPEICPRLFPKGAKYEKH